MSNIITKVKATNPTTLIAYFGDKYSNFYQKV